MTPWHDCAPCHSQPDGSPSDTDPPSGQLNVPANSRQLGPPGALPAYRLPNYPRHGRTAANIVPVGLPLTPPSSPSIGIWLGPFAFPCPSSLVSTTRTSRFGGFGLTNAPASPPTSLTAMIAPSAASLARLPAPRPIARVPLAATDAAARTTLPVISLLRPRWLRSSVSLTCSLTPLRGIPWSAHVAHARCAANRCQPELHAKRNEPYFAVDSGEYLRSVVSCQLARNIPTRSGPFQRNTRWFSTAVRLNIASRPVAQLENLQMQTGARRRKARF